MKATKTVNPLHFEDMEPHRFEDLVRQLIYDFKKWKNLEATGAGGSDDGFDIRGWEDYRIDESGDDYDDTDENEKIQPIKKDRVWLIQCKREKTITPKKIEKFVNSIKSDPILYGIIFVAACDFSKKTRDRFIGLIREKGFKEFHLWGKKEIEDSLFQPKNDHLLFAYFNISLKIRERSVKSQLRSRLSTKRKVLKSLVEHHPILLRNIEDDLYPDKDKIKNFKEKLYWDVFTFRGRCYCGIKILLKKFFAYIDINPKNGKLISWDIYGKCNDSIEFQNNPWISKKNNGKGNNDRYAIWRYWSNIPKTNRAMFIEEGIIPYDRIIAIDEDGDEYVDDTHVYIQLNNRNEICDFYYNYLESSNISTNRRFSLDEKKRKRYFPKDYKVIEKKVKKIEIEYKKKLEQKNLKPEN